MKNRNLFSTKTDYGYQKNGKTTHTSNFSTCLVNFFSQFWFNVWWRKLCYPKLFCCGLKT